MHSKDVDVFEKRLNQLNTLYDMLEHLKEKGKIANTYGGCEDDFCDPDGDVLCDFMEYIGVYYETLEKDDWLESFYQVLCWQYQSMHEGVVTYYENFYGGSEYPTLVKTAEFLRTNDYLDIYEQYNRGVVECERYEYPEAMKKVAGEIDMWINWHTKEVWDFCVDILAKYKEEWY